MCKSNNNSPVIKEALTKAMRLCSSKEYSSRGMMSKIISWGCSGEDAQSVINMLTEQNFLDDRRYAEAFMNDKLRINKWGRIKISYMMRMEGIDDEIIQTVIYDIDEASYEQLLKDELIKKRKTIKVKNIDELHNKLFRFAASRGFESDIISQLVREIILSYRSRTILLFFPTTNK